MITQKEYELLKHYRATGYRWIARDRDYDIYAFKSIPTKFISFWIEESGSSLPSIVGECGDNILTCVKWEDEEPTRIDDLIRDYEAHKEIVGEKVKVVIPQFLADWIQEVKGTYTLKLLFANSDMPSSVEDWLYCNNENCEKMALAWIYGYEVEQEKEKLYIVALPNYQRLSKIDDTIKFLDIDEWFVKDLKTQLTQAEIESVEPRLMQFAEEVE